MEFSKVGAGQTGRPPRGFQLRCGTAVARSHVGEGMYIVAIAIEHLRKAFRNAGTLPGRP